MSFGRVIELLIQTKSGQQITIKNLRIKFKVLKTSQKEPNEIEVTIYNLTRQTFDKIAEVDNILIVKAGYKDEGGAKTISIANITEGLFLKETTETRTILTAFDGQKDYRAFPVSLSYKKGVTVQSIVNGILRIIQIPVAKQVVIPTSTYETGYSFVGRAFDALSEVLNRVGLSYTIQNNELYIIKKGQTVQGVAQSITPETGLLEAPTPKKSVSGQNSAAIQKAQYSVRTLLNAVVLPESIINIKCATVNGFFKVQSIEHDADNWQNVFESTMEVIEA